jgi:hypothetical protein
MLRARVPGRALASEASVETIQPERESAPYEEVRLKKP